MIQPFRFIFYDFSVSDNATESSRSFPLSRAVKRIKKPYFQAIWCKRVRVWNIAITRGVDGSLKSPRSLSGRSIHLTLITKWLWSWSSMTYCHRLCAMSIGPPILRYSYFTIWPWKSMVKAMCVVKGQGQAHWSHLRPGVQSICCFSFRGNRTTFGWDIGNSIFDLENSRSRSWPRSNLMFTFEASEFNRYVCFSFRRNQTIFGWDVANSIFNLEKFKVKVMVKIKPDGHIWAIEFNQYAFRFLAIGPFLAEI